MQDTLSLDQTPLPGERIVRFQGDVQTFTLALSHPCGGQAWLRTNLGRAAISRGEIISEVESGSPRLGRDWFDLPMGRVDERVFRIRLPLIEVGHFEAKVFFLPQNAADPLWPEGPNSEINIEPADTCCANIIYNAFVRQFGPNKAAGGFPDPSADERVQALDQAGYTVIPPSGTFRGLAAELDFIIGRLGCTVIQLLPIHPTPTIYARMGRFGSPYAALGFTAVDPALAEFDPAATPLEQFVELVDGVHARQAKILIDIAANHTGWAASLHETHPEWLVRDEEGRIEAPGAWGVTWADLTRLDYTHKDLWAYMADVFLTWCRRGVDGFRCDAGYMIPVAAWDYIIATVRNEFAETIFLLEGLGGPMPVTRDLLNRAGFNWAYSELFQNYDREQIEHYLPGALQTSHREGIMVHFAETHDNNRLAARSPAWARMRTALCALSCANGGFAFANGVEWLATEKISVHGAASLNWGADVNQVEAVARLNRVLKAHPAFHDRVEATLVQAGEGNHVVILRRHRPTGRRLLVAANLDDRHPATVRWHPAGNPPENPVLYDLLTARTVRPQSGNSTRALELAPGEVLCLSEDPADLTAMAPGGSATKMPPPRRLTQRLRHKALAVWQAFHGMCGLEDMDPDSMASMLRRNVLEFCRSVNPIDDSPRAITWHYPRDTRREVMLPPGHCLLIRADAPMRAGLTADGRRLQTEKSLAAAGGGHFVLFTPPVGLDTRRSLVLSLTVFDSPGPKHLSAPLLYLGPHDRTRIRCSFSRKDLQARDLLFLGTNGRGAMLRAKARWGELGSRYDALLAANPDPRIPVNRRILLSRCRAWIAFQGYSQQICSDCTDSFGYGRSGDGWWRFQIPAGQGQNVRITVRAAMTNGENSVSLIFHRHGKAGRDDTLDDGRPVRLILRPDIENRSFHDLTKAFLGPERDWPAAVSAQTDGVTFAPDPDWRLAIRVGGSRFVYEPEWHYMVRRHVEAERGQDPDSDLFSPGHFSVDLTGGATAILTAELIGPGQKTAAPADPPEVPDPLSDLPPLAGLKRALSQFVVRRGAYKSVIAGYPWFLDWGRDALIFTRGLIAAGHLADAREVMIQFGRFEDRGTLPNMIVGDDAANRDTADAPLWLIVACGDLIAAEGSDRFLDASCGDRTIRQVLTSIGQWLLAGTPNGLKTDPDSGLLYSPAHFTWMDTDHPAGTPRAGYPIEIQALWFAALTFLARIDNSPGDGRPDWAEAAGRVRASIHEYYPRQGGGYLADCLHCDPGTPARKAEADDALRPNQLFAITLGAVDDPDLGRKILSACEELLVPGAIRSLADRPVSRPLPIVHQGRPVNDPHRPYQGTYAGDEDSRRKPAYHNGTAWTWVFPSFCEAWAAVYGKSAAPTALAWLSSAVDLVNRGCVGHVPEILDGDAPHTQRGCDAQAWGASEVLRVWKLLAQTE